MKKTLLLLALSATSFAASAGELSYNYIDFGYAQVNFDNSQSRDAGAGVGAAASANSQSVQDMRFKGYFLRGSVELGASPFYLFGNYGQGSDTTTTHSGANRVTFDTKQRNYEAGVGVHYGLNDRTDLLLETSYGSGRLTVEHKGMRERVNTEGLRVAAGVRGLMTDNLEGWAKANYTQGEYTSGQFGGELGAQYRFGKTWGIVGQYNYTRDESGFQVGVRASF